MNGLAFCSVDGRVARSQDYDATFIKLLERVQEWRPDLFAPNENIRDRYGISCSLHKGSMSEAKIARISEPEINLMNQWRKVERAAGWQPKFYMQEHYSEVKMMLKPLLHYPMAL